MRSMSRHVHVLACETARRGDAAEAAADDDDTLPPPHGATSGVRGDRSLARAGPASSTSAFDCLFAIRKAAARFRDAPILCVVSISPSPEAVTRKPSLPGSAMAAGIRRPVLARADHDRQMRERVKQTRRRRARPAHKSAETQGPRAAEPQNIKSKTSNQARTPTLNQSIQLRAADEVVQTEASDGVRPERHLARLVRNLHVRMVILFVDHPREPRSRTRWSRESS